MLISRGIANLPENATGSVMETTNKGLLACAIVWAVMALLWTIVLVKRLCGPGEKDWTYISLVVLTILAGITNVVIYVRRMKK